MSEPCVIIEPMVNQQEFLICQIFSSSSGDLSHGCGFSQSFGANLKSVNVVKLEYYLNLENDIFLNKIQTSLKRVITKIPIDRPQPCKSIRQRRKVLEMKIARALEVSVLNTEY